MARHTRAGVHRNNAVCTSSQPFLNVVEMFCNTLSYSQSKGVSRVCGRRGSRSPAKASRPRLPLPGARQCARPHIRTLTTRNHWHPCIPSTFLSHTEVSGEPHSVTRSCSPPSPPPPRSISRARLLGWHHPGQQLQAPAARGPAGEDVLPRAAPRILTKPNTCGRRAEGGCWKLRGGLYLVSSRDFGLGFERPTLATETIGEQARARRSGGWGDGAQGEAAEGRRLCQPRPGPAHGAGSSGCSLPLSSSTQGKGVLGTVEANPSFPAICGGGNAPGAGAGAGAGGGERGRRRARGCQLPRPRPAGGPGGTGQTPRNGGRSGTGRATAAPRGTAAAPVLGTPPVRLLPGG